MPRSSGYLKERPRSAPRCRWNCRPSVPLRPTSICPALPRWKDGYTRRHASVPAHLPREPRRRVELPVGRRARGPVQRRHARPDRHRAPTGGSGRSPRSGRAAPDGGRATPRRCRECTAGAHPLLGRRRRRPARACGRARGHRQRGRAQSPAPARPDPGGGRPAPPGARRRHAVPVAGGHVVDGALPAAAVAGRRARAGRGPRRQGVQRDPSGGRAVPGHGPVRRARRRRRRLPVGRGLLDGQPRVFRCRRPAHRPSGAQRTGAVRGRLLGVLPGRGRRRRAQGALALPDRPLGRPTRSRGAWPARRSCRSTPAKPTGR